MADLDDVSGSSGGDGKGWNGTAHSTVPGEKTAELEAPTLNEAHQARSQLGQSIDQFPDATPPHTNGPGGAQA